MTLGVIAGNAGQRGLVGTLSWRDNAGTTRIGRHCDPLSPPDNEPE